jgi:hypothetical protein
MAAITIGTPALDGAVTGFNTSQLQPTSLSNISISGYNNIWTTSINRVYSLQINEALPPGINFQSAASAPSYAGSFRPAFGQLYPRGTQ